MTDVPHPAEREAEPFDEPRLPPEALDAEMALVGALTVDNGAAVDTLRALGFDPDDMLDRFLADTVRAALTGEAPHDPITLAAQLGDHDRPLERLAEIMRTAPFALSMVGRYAALIHSAAHRRHVIAAAAELIDSAYLGDVLDADRLVALVGS